MLNQEGTTIILVTHESEVAEYARQTVFVRDGLIMQSETTVKGGGSL